MSPGEAEGVFTGELAILAASVVYGAWKPLRRAWGAVRAGGRVARARWRDRNRKRDGLPRRLARRQRRMRHDPVPQDGKWLNQAEQGAWLDALMALGDKAGTQRVAVMEAAAEEMMREAGA